MADEDSMAPLRRCTRCLELKPATLDFFGPHKMGKYGLHSRCRPCKKIDEAELRARPDQKVRQQAWRDANKSAVRDYNLAYRAAGYKSTAHVAEWRSRNVEKCRAYEREKARRLYAANPAKFIEAQRRYAQRHAEKIRESRARRYRTDRWFNLKHRFSVRLRKMLVGKFPSKNTERLLGFGRAELVEHIERQFTPGMTWARLFAGEIEIDHIIPVCSFDIREPRDAEFNACWALANLRPMWRSENRRKGGKRLTLL